MRVVHIVEAEAALDAEAVVVRRTVPALGVDDLVVLDLIGDLAADAAEGAQRIDLPVGIRAHVWFSSTMRDGISAPVGQACTHSPQATQVDWPIGSSKSNTILASPPRPAMPMTSLTWTSRQARTHRPHWMQASRLTAIAGWLPSVASVSRAAGKRPVSIPDLVGPVPELGRALGTCGAG